MPQIIQILTNKNPVICALCGQKTASIRPIRKIRGQFFNPILYKKKTR